MQIFDAETLMKNTFSISNYCSSLKTEKKNLLITFLLFPPLKNVFKSQQFIAANELNEPKFPFEKNFKNGLFQFNHACLSHFSVFIKYGYSTSSPIMFFTPILNFELPFFVFFRFFFLFVFIFFTAFAQIQLML